MDKLKISVVMPVYNVEKYLKGAVASILSQSYDNFELILVDDCSPDSCGEMCDEIAKGDARVKVIHKPVNQGLGLARNTGMEHCTGDYITFVDSDDTVESDTLEKLAGFIDGGKYQIVAFGLVQDYINADGEIAFSDEIKADEEMQAFNRADIARAAMQMDLQRIFPYACNKIYSRAFLQENSLLFDETKLMEDFVFNIAVFAKAESLLVVPDVFYHYMKPMHETLASAYNPDFFNLCKMRYGKEVELLEKAGVKDEFFRQAARDIFIKHILSVIIRNDNPKANLTFGQRHSLVKEILNDKTVTEMLKNSNTSSLAIKVLQFVFKAKLSLVSMLLAKVYEIKQSTKHR